MELNKKDDSCNARCLPGTGEASTDQVGPLQFDRWKG